MNLFLCLVHGLYALAWLAIMIIFWVDTFKGYAMNTEYVIIQDFVIFMALLVVFAVECMTCWSLLNQ